MAEDFKLYGSDAIAAHLGIHPETLRRWRKRPQGHFIEVGSMSNAGGGYGRAAWTFVSSADNLKRVMENVASEAHRDAANARWEGVQWTIVRAKD